MTRRNLIVLAATAALAACITPPAPTTRDIEFVRGCWIARDPDTTSTLRLLPGRDGETYTGNVLVYSGNTVEQREMYIFTRNGSQATVLGPKGASGTPRYKIVGRAVDGYSSLKPGWRMAAFSETWRLGNQEMIRVEGDAEHLRIVTALRYGGGPQVVMFDGRRDGCD